RRRVATNDAECRARFDRAYGREDTIQKEIDAVDVRAPIETSEKEDLLRYWFTLSRDFIEATNVNTVIYDCDTIKPKASLEELCILLAHSDDAGRLAEDGSLPTLVFVPLLLDVEPDQRVARRFMVALPEERLDVMGDDDAALSRPMQGIGVQGRLELPEVHLPGGD